MALGEFELIRRFFATPADASFPGLQLGIGDDCALLAPLPGQELAITVDTLVSGVHFFPDVDPEKLGHKCLAVNLSDLAAMGAEPAWMTLALTLPEANERWLSAFAGGLFKLARRYGMNLIGGDTTRGPLSITIQAMGRVPPHQALRRSAARPGDRIYVSGPLGSAGLGLKTRLGETRERNPEAIHALECPEPRIELGQRLRGWANACIDISDGLAADLGHILTASQAGAWIDFGQIPLTGEVSQYIHESGDWQLPLTAGDDYELCFTVPRSRAGEMESLFQQAGFPVTCIGEIEAEPGLRLRRNSQVLPFTAYAYEHFRHD